MLSFLVALLYLALAWHFYRTRWKDKTNPLSLKSETLLVGAVILLHGWQLGTNLITPQGLDLGIGNTLSMLAWLVVLFVFGSNLLQNLASLYPALLPLAALCAGMQGLLPEHHVPLNSSLPLFKVHLLIALSAYSLLSITTLLAVFITVIEYNLHHLKSGNRLLKNLPPLLALEKLLFHIMKSGFVLLTATLISGSYFTHILTSQWFVMNHKNLFSLLSWVVFGVLLAGHLLWGWRGRLAARLTIFGSVMLVLGYVGSKFVLEVLLHRS